MSCYIPMIPQDATIRLLCLADFVRQKTHHRITMIRL
jgi:hypothetical protein